jgi:hypothetical protein
MPIYPSSKSSINLFFALYEIAEKVEVIVEVIGFARNSPFRERPQVPKVRTGDIQRDLSSIIFI